MDQENRNRPLRVLASPAQMVKTDNPYPELLYGGVRNAGPTEVVEYSPRGLLTEKWDVVHIHWPELRIWRENSFKFVMSAMLFIAGLQLARLRGAKVVWTAHNPIPPNRTFPRLNRWYQRAFFTQVDGIISLTNTGLERLQDRLPIKPTTPVTLIRHGHYKDAYRVTRQSQEECRAKLGLPEDAKLILCLGQVRPEKKIERLIETFEERSDPDLNLVVAGPVRTDGLDEELTSLSDANDNIQLSLDAVAPEDISSWLKASDVVVVPYEIVNSGSAILPPSLGRCVVLPDCDGSRELLETMDPGWVELYQADDPETFFDAINTALEAKPDELPELNKMNWAGIGRQTRDFYLRVTKP